MFTPAVWDLLVDETNRYAHFKLRNPPSCHGIMSGGSQTKSQRWSSYIIKNMLGVDTMDQLATQYSFLCKSVKWWQKVMFWLLQVSIVNSYISYTTTLRRLGQQPQSHLQFCHEFILQFVAHRLQLAPPSRFGPHVDLSLERLRPVTRFF